MKKSKRVVVIAAVLAAAILTISIFACCNSDNDRVYRNYSEIKTSGKIRIGVSSDNNPLSFAGEDGEYQGFEINIAKRLAKELKVKAEFVSTENENRAKYLETGKVDAVIADYAENTDSKKLVDFASPYMKTALGAVASDENKGKTLDKLGENERVIVISGSAAALYMTKNYPKVYLKECADENEAINALTGSRGVLWLDSNTETASYAYQTDGYTLVSKELGDTSSIAPAVSKGNTTLLKKINKAFKKLNKEGFFKTAYDETLTDVYGADFEDTLLVNNK